ncbi:P-loop containing nucleoside triphosphate hydrolase, partial [Sesbania bispinosa]
MAQNIEVPPPQPQDHEKTNNQKVPFYKLFTFADRLDVALMIIGTICAMANGLSQPLMTIILGKLINAFGSNVPSQVVNEVSKVSCWMVTGERQATRIRGLYLKTILKQDIAFFDTETTTGEVIGRMSGDTILIQDSMGEKVGKFIQLASTFFGGFVIAFVRGWQLALVLLSCIPLVIIAGGFMSVLMSRMSSRGQAAYAEAGNVVEQIVGAIRTVASFTGEKKAKEKYNNKLKVAYTTMVQQGMVSGLGMGVLLLIIFCTYGLAMWYGSKLVIEKGYIGGTVITVIVALMTGGMSLGQASPCVNAFATGQAAAYKMFETIKRKPKIDAYDTSGVILEDIKGDIELKDVYFTYPARPDVQIFTGFSLFVPNGTTTALVGQSGSGKSTVISLLERFYDPDAGEVLIDGVNLKSLQVRWIREQIGLVSQEPILFTTSIKENIAYAKEGATDEEIATAITLANAKKFIDKLPQGLDTRAGQNGTQLSGGQKQRIAIARAILKNPKILLLDEATSALDAESERIVQEALERVMSKRTTVVVAHRLTTIRNADTITVVHQGKIVEKGTHDELIKDADDGHMARSISRGSSGSRHSQSFSFALPYQSGGQTEEVDVEQSHVDNKKPKRFSIRRLAYLNKPEVPVLLLGSIAAAINGGVVFPTFGLLFSSAIVMFFKPPEQQQKDARFWTLLYVGLGLVTLVVLPLQNYFFGIAGGKLIERIRSLTFEKVVHQEISWFDDPSNSSGAVGARLSTDASTVKSLVDDTLALMVQNISTITTGLVIAFTANWILALIILAVSPLVIMQGCLQMRFLKGFSADAKVKYEEASQVATDAVGNIRTVASFCAESKVMDMYKKKCSGPEKQGSVLVRHGLATFSEVFR